MNHEFTRLPKSTQKRLLDTAVNEATATSQLAAYEKSVKWYVEAEVGYRCRLRVAAEGKVDNSYAVEKFTAIRNEILQEMREVYGRPTKEELTEFERRPRNLHELYSPTSPTATDVRRLTHAFIDMLNSTCVHVPPDVPGEKYPTLPIKSLLLPGPLLLALLTAQESYLDYYNEDGSPKNKLAATAQRVSAQYMKNRNAVDESKVATFDDNRDRLVLSAMMDLRGILTFR